jgi:hypothetical protein
MRSRWIHIHGAVVSPPHRIEEGQPVDRGYRRGAIHVRITAGRLAQRAYRHGTIDEKGRFTPTHRQDTGNIATFAQGPRSSKGQAAYCRSNVGEIVVYAKEATASD